MTRAPFATGRPRSEMRRETVIALHCSGATGKEWQALGDALGDDFALATPEQYGTPATGPWPGEHRFALADEAAAVLGLIDAAGSPIHLVGHSYGGGLALSVAAARPERVASVALYEPSAFHLLGQLGPEGGAALAEITALARGCAEAVASGDQRGGVRRFVDYWNGPGAFDALRPDLQRALTRWAPKAPLDFQALLEERRPLSAYRALAMPALLLRGEAAPRPTRLIAERLAETLPDARLTVLAGAGHMGPLTHAVGVAGLIAAHIRTAAGCAEAPRRLARAG